MTGIDDAQRDELLRLVARRATADGQLRTPIPFADVLRWSRPTDTRQGVLEPSLCVVLQGTKELRVAGETFRYGAFSYVMSAIDFPSAGRVTGATRTALAKSARMSVSSLRHEFKATTALAPLQYQKQLRLQEARRLMLSGELDAGGAAFRVGYESPSQFSREYRRLFGAPPMRSVRGPRDPSIDQGITP